MEFLTQRPRREDAERRKGTSKVRRLETHNPILEDPKAFLNGSFLFLRLLFADFASSLRGLCVKNSGLPFQQNQKSPKRGQGLGRSLTALRKQIAGDF
jgi:hypothetical protein